MRASPGSLGYLESLLHYRSGDPVGLLPESHPRPLVTHHPAVEEPSIPIRVSKLCILASAHLPELNGASHTCAYTCRGIRKANRE